MERGPDRWTCDRSDRADRTDSRIRDAALIDGYGEELLVRSPGVSGANGENVRKCEGGKAGGGTGRARGVCGSQDFILGYGHGVPTALTVWNGEVRVWRATSATGGRAAARGEVIDEQMNRGQENGCAEKAGLHAVFPCAGGGSVTSRTAKT